MADFPDSMQKMLNDVVSDDDDDGSSYHLVCAKHYGRHFSYFYFIQWPRYRYFTPILDWGDWLMEVSFSCAPQLGREVLPEIKGLYF